MSLAAATPESALSSDRGHETTLLGIPAELRNAIYEYTFSTEFKSKPTPHPLTQVNKQIRRESLGMYYKSVTFLKLELQSLKKIRCVKKWLAEFDLAAYGALPAIEFCPVWLANQPRTAMYVTREEVCPAKELPVYISLVSSLAFTLLGSQPPDRPIRDRAVDAMYHDLIGESELMYEDICPQAPEHFVQVVENGESWIRRRPHFEGLSASSWIMAEGEEADAFKGKVVETAVRNQGRDWDKRDLGEIVKWFEDCVWHREKTLR